MSNKPNIRVRTPRLRVRTWPHKREVVRAMWARLAMQQAVIEELERLEDDDVEIPFAADPVLTGDSIKVEPMGELSEDELATVLGAMGGQSCS